MSQITSADSAIIAASLEAAFHTTMLQFDEEQQYALGQKVLTLVMTSKPYLWATPDGLHHLIHEVFGDAVFMDFVFMLQYNFMIRWGEAPQKFIALANTVSWGLTSYTDPNVKPADELSAIPEELRFRLAARVPTGKLLEENPWMVCLALLRSYVSKDAVTGTSPAPKAPRPMAANAENTAVVPVVTR
jgi:hypothetical protein